MDVRLFLFCTLDRYTQASPMALNFPTYDVTDYGNRPGDGPFRMGGIEQSSLPTEDKQNLPSTLSPAAERQVEALELVRDLSDGADRVRAQGKKYLPNAPGEDPANYRDRLARSVFLNAFGQTAEGLTGFVFRRDPKLGEDVPPVILEHWENIDNAGSHGDVFIRDLLQDALTAGHVAVLVDYPNTGGQVLSLADEEGLRPYWVPIRKDNILSWRTAIESGRTVLTQIVLRESHSVPDGAFGEKEIVQYRVLTRDLAEVDPVRFQLLEVTKDKQVLVVDEGVYKNQKEIPLVEVASSGRKSLFESTPPLIDLAHLNIAHYQQWSDYAWSIHKTNVPILFGSGFPQEQESDGTRKPPIVVGANSAIITTAPDAKLMYVAHDGAALGESQKALDDLLRDMATFGLSMLSPDKKAQDNSTATAKRIDKASNDSSLSVVARSLQDAIERCLDFHAAYLGLPEGGSIVINRDFENLTLTPVEISAIAALVAQGDLSQETMWDILIEGNVLASDFDKDEERARISADMTVKAAVAAANEPIQPKADPATGKPSGSSSMEIHYDEKTGRPVKLVKSA